MTITLSEFEAEQYEKAQKIEDELNAARDEKEDTLALFKYYTNHRHVPPEQARYMAEQTLWAMNENRGFNADGSEVSNAERGFLQADRLANGRVHARKVTEEDPSEGFIVVNPPNPGPVTVWPDLH